MSAALSYSSGESAAPLLGDTARSWLDAQVIGVPDAKYGEELMVWVRLRAGAPELTAESLREFCAGQLAHYKIPRYVHIVDEFPMTVTGKVRNVEMRERAVSLLGLDAAGPR
jgi:fatty-acyl-CoA synthase